MRVAAINWKIREIEHEEEFFDHLSELLSRCHDVGTDVAVLPEVFDLELLHLAPDLPERDTARWLGETFGQVINDSLRVAALATGMTVIGGSHFRILEGELLNSCLVTNGETEVWQDKVKLTQYESQLWGVAPGSGLARLRDPRLGVAICYDCEFPECGRAHAESGVLIQLVPSYTETIRGYQRVRWCCRTRAIENQFYVVHASLVGDLGREPIPSTYGSSAILTPSIEPFPENAILAESPMNEEAIAVADIDLDLLTVARASGDVRNWQDRSPEWTLHGS